MHAYVHMHTYITYVWEGGYNLISCRRPLPACAAVPEATDAQRMVCVCTQSL